MAVEKLHFLQNSKNLGDRKCLGKLRKSFVGHPDTILFSRISRKRVFQHPQAITPSSASRSDWCLSRSTTGLSFTAKPSPASTAGSSPSARISQSRTMRWLVNFCVSNSKMADGTARRLNLHQNVH